MRLLIILSILLLVTLSACSKSLPLTEIVTCNIDGDAEGKVCSSGKYSCIITGGNCKVSVREKKNTNIEFSLNSENCIVENSKVTVDGISQNLNFICQNLNSNVSVVSVSSKYDVDSDSLTLNSTDAQIIQAYLFGAPLSQLSELKSNSSSLSDSELLARLETLKEEGFFDVNGDGKNNALSDASFIGLYLAAFEENKGFDESHVELFNSEGIRTNIDSLFSFMEDEGIKITSLSDVYDVDFDGTISAENDGQIIIGYLFEAPTFQLMQLKSNSSNVTEGALEERLNVLKEEGLLDVDLDGKNNALSDGVLLSKIMKRAEKNENFYLADLGNLLAQDADRNSREKILDFLSSATLNLNSNEDKEELESELNSSSKNESEDSKIVFNETNTSN